MFQDKNGITSKVDRAVERLKLFERDKMGAAYPASFGQLYTASVQRFVIRHAGVGNALLIHQSLGHNMSNYRIRSFNANSGCSRKRVPIVDGAFVCPDLISAFELRF